MSKWETGNSCPDITLLCPLARALGTDVDTLLQFEEAISEEQLVKEMNEIIEMARKQNVVSAEKALQDLLYRYPSNSTLKYYAALAFNMFAVFYPSKDFSEKKELWMQQKKELLEEVRADKTSVYWQNTILSLASNEIVEGNLKEAEELLKELPEHMTDATMIWAQLYIKKGDTEKALEVVQKCLFVLVNQVLGLLQIMTSDTIQPDGEKALKICGIYHQIEEIFGCGSGMSAGIFAEIHKRLGENEKAMEYMIRFIDAMTGTAQMPTPLLFFPGVNTKTDQKASTTEMRKMLLQGILAEESMSEFLENENFMAAVEKLKASIC